MTNQVVFSSLQEGKIFGEDGALALAHTEVLPNAEKGNISALMQMANVHYTAIGASVASYGAVLGRILALYHLWKAKRFAERAFLTFGYQHWHVEYAVAYFDVLKHENPCTRHELDVGDVHILMSCYAQWIVQVLKRLSLPHKRELEVVASCEKAISRHGQPDIKILACVTLFSLDPNEKLGKRLLDFWQSGHADIFIGVPRGFHYYMESDFPDKEHKDAVMTVCRVGRALGFFDEVVQLAEKYELYDQKEKALAGI